VSKKLVIVESPAKAKTIGKILGKDYVVESSIGHIRDLPGSAADIPAAYKSESWARLGVDVDNDFKPLYVVPKKKKPQVTKLKGLMKNADEVYLATDEDREGESIAWHLLEVLNPQVPVKRMVFHEITKEAVQEAAEHPRDLDRRLVDAQEARRILDRLYGYEVSPVLWRKVLPKLSAGRVQSVATRVIVERERERLAFRSAGYWDLEGTFKAASDPAQPFGATLATVNGQRVASGRDFDSLGTVTKSDVVVLDEASATGLRERLDGVDFKVVSVENKPFTRSPYAPFITSTLQQEAARKLGFTSRRTMQVAQGLYEKGHITYMRTDSTTLSESAIRSARDQAVKLYGDKYVPEKPRRYASKVRNAQEAHEAIRPAGDVFKLPDQVSRELDRDEARLYELIWKRTVASQMSDAKGESSQVRIGASSRDNETVEFTTSGKVIHFPGFLRAYVEGSDDPESALEDQEVRLPAMAEGDRVTAAEIIARDHSTQPPGRYSEASLVKKLEEMGVGRPSTYASIIGTIQDRGYVWKKGSALVPSFTAFAVISLLEKHFARLVDYDFTAAMEEDLDEIAAGEEESLPWLTRFYFGNGGIGLKDLVHSNIDEIDAREVNSIPLGKDSEGREIVVRVGRYGPYLQRDEERVSIPEDLPPDELSVEKADELLKAPSQDRILGDDPDTGRPIVLKNGRYGPYVQLGEIEEGSKEKPKTASLFKTMDPQTVTFEEAQKLLSLPRVIGVDPADDHQIEALNGRYGPYIKKGKETRSVETEEELFTLSLDRALELLAQPKAGRRGGASSILRELGPDPATESPITVKTGRYGPYVTDGKTNASLPRGESVEEITLEKAAEMLAEKRTNPPKKKTRRKAKA
jgi:DNA topoisomerase-1